MSVHIDPGTNIQSVINLNAAGTVYCLRPGAHRLQSLVPKNGDQIIGEYGAILSGARALTEWFQDGSRWYVNAQTQQGALHPGAECLPDYPMCGYPEDLFFDNNLKTRAVTLSAVAPGRWFLDTAGDRIYVGDNPAGHIVETSVNTQAISGSASAVTIKNLYLEKYANPGQSGALNGENSSSWQVLNCEARYNHGIGIRVGNSMTVQNCGLHHNQQMGIGGIGSNVLVDTNEIHHNNVQFNYGWEGGGTKFVKTDGLILRNNYSHHNQGPGLWLDIDNLDYLIENNRSEDNDGTAGAAGGIMIEISWGGVIRNNICRRNSLHYAGYGWGAGILIAASGGQLLDIYGNTVEDNGDGIVLIQQDRNANGTELATFWPGPNNGYYLCQNVSVHNNNIRQPNIGTDVIALGAVQDAPVNGDGGTGIFARNNHFEANASQTQGSTNYFAWNGGIGSFAAWQGYGHDTPVGSCSTF